MKFLENYPQANEWFTRSLRAFRLAVSFLTILPVGAIGDDIGEAEVAESRFAYPVVGWLLGALMALVCLILGKLGVSGNLLAWLVVAMSAVFTGGLHLDGLADTCDGLFLTGDRERRLAAMKDPHIGSFGVVCLTLVLLGKFAALEGLSRTDRPIALIGAFAVSRTLILVVSGLSSYARPQGTGRTIIEATPPREAWIFAGVALFLGVLHEGFHGVIAAVIALGVIFVLVKWAKSRIGGITGDILGAGVESSELTFLFAFGWHRS